MRNFLSKYKLSIPQLAKLIDMQITRVVAILDGDKPTEYEGIKLDRLKKFKSFITKPLSIDTIVNEQTKSIESAKKTILKKTRLSHCMTEDIEDYLEDLRVSSMYLGMLYANNNEDEKVLSEVRKRRNI